MTHPEPSPATRKFQKELNAGTVSFVLLGVLSHATEPLYGYQIAKQLETGSEDVTMMKQGALYPVLRSLEKNGLLASRVEPSLSGPPRRYYEITETGREAFAQWTTIWHHNTRFVDAVLKGSYHV
ncbi:MAG: PadR family transcriptional regulator [Gemmatimonadota bacterium]|nr:MAG: PadR family transcriptional regulator [Gemmatimonadota bacterium]